MSTKLKKYRKELDMTQIELAKKTRLSVRNIQNWEQGVRDLKKAYAENVYVLAKALHVTMEDLLD